MIRFGTDGVRGPAGQHPITPEGAVALGRAAARLADGGRVLIGQDTRPSGTWLSQAVAAGVAGQGGSARLLGVLPTAGVSAGLAAGLGEVGVMVTASHNPWPDNGLKVLGPDGKKLSDARQAEVEAWVNDPPQAARPGGVEALSHEGLSTYLQAARKAWGPLGALAGRKVAVDLANGAATVVLDALRQALPCELVVVGDGGLTNGGVGSEHPEALRQAVLDHGCIAGLAVDGDADRCLLVDEQGRELHGDRLIWLLARGRGIQRLAVTVMSTYALEPALRSVRIERTGVGDRLLTQAMAAHDLQMGAEESGHVLFSDALPSGDGLVTGLRALVAALSTAPTLSEAVASFRPWPRAKAKVWVTHRPELASVPALTAAVDEARPLTGGGRVFLRYSGTEPVLRILVEGPDAGGVQSAMTLVEAAATAALG